MIKKSIYTLALSVFFVGLLAKTGFSFFASSAQQKEGVGKVIEEEEIIIIPDDPDDPPIIDTYDP
ncbi:MAG: hypothetical protein P1V35_15305, partial [Planctomycetota bacterium]|nr:hypothetical protein [Planctomycetota bacterium]